LGDALTLVRAAPGRRPPRWMAASHWCAPTARPRPCQSSCSPGELLSGHVYPAILRRRRLGSHAAGERFTPHEHPHRGRTVCSRGHWATRRCPRPRRATCAVWMVADFCWTYPWLSACLWC